MSRPPSSAPCWQVEIASKTNFKTDGIPWRVNILCLLRKIKSITQEKKKSLRVGQGLLIINFTNINKNVGQLIVRACQLIMQN
jgi:hypothetical protein